MNPTRFIQAIYITLSLLVLIGDTTAQLPKRTVVGSYDLKATLTNDSKIFFSGSAKGGHQSFLSVDRQGITINTLNNGRNIELKRVNGSVSYPCNIRILKKGNFFRFWVDSLNTFVRGPLGEWQQIYEPLSNEVYASKNSAILKNSFSIEQSGWQEKPSKALIKYGPPGSFYEQQAIPGAIIKIGNKYYMYFMAGMKGKEEGSSSRSIGLAISDNLVDWNVLPEPVVSQKDYPYDNLYINGAAITPDNKIALLFSAQQFPDWKGFMLATADNPQGPFTAYPNNPVYKHFTHAHEFDLIDQHDSPVVYNGVKYRYLLFYAGFTPNITSKGKPGDKGYLIYSNDLKNWVSDEENPVFGPETADNWDAGHVRPRSLTYYKGLWYLWYEGANYWTPGDTAVARAGWFDTIGFARSEDLHNWEYYPQNPALPGLGLNDAQVGSAWVGWPRMIVHNNIGYVFFCGSHDGGKVSITCRTIPMNQLTNW